MKHQFHVLFDLRSFDLRSSDVQSHSWVSRFEKETQQNQQKTNKWKRKEKESVGIVLK